MDDRWYVRSVTRAISTPRRPPLVAAVLALVLSACVSMNDAPVPSPTPFVRPALPAHLDASPLVLHPWNEAGMAAALPGRLVLEDGCLYVVAEELGGRWLLTFPYPGTDWDGTAVRYDGEELPVGELFVFGGGEVDLTEADAGRFDWVKAPDPACLIGKAWFVYNVDAASP